MHPLKLIVSSMLMLALSSIAKAEAIPDRLAYRACSEQTALLILPAILMPALPPGFVYTTPAGGDSLLAGIHISNATCKTADNTTEQQVFAFAMVKPPAELTTPEVPFYAIALGGYSNNPKMVATFEAWGLSGLIEPAAVDIKLTVSPLARIGKATARGAHGSLTSQVNGVGLPTSFGAGRSRAYYIQNGVLIASFDATYTNQTGIDGAGTVIQAGQGPLPPGVYGALGSHAWGYDLSVGDVQYY